MNKTYSAIIALSILPLTAGCTAIFGDKSNAPDAFGMDICKKTTESGLGYTILKKGSDVKAGPRDSVKVNYRGKLASNGTVFDEGEGIEFPVGGVVPGFGEGTQLVGVGGKIRLCIPAPLAYGETARGQIPANSDLNFDVDMLGVTAAPPEQLTGKDLTCDTKTESGLGYQVIEEAKGEKAAEKPQDSTMVTLDYAGYLASDGKLFDNGNGAKFAPNRVVPGFGEGVKLMGRGAKYRLCIPAKLGYGANGAGPIPPNSELIFNVTVKDF